MESMIAEHRRPWLLRGGVIIAAITFVGLLLRLYSIGSESLWLDEGFSTLAAKRPLGDVLRFIRGEDLHPPLYYVLLHFWIGWFGDSETTMRVLSAIFGTLSIPLVYRLGRDFMDRKAAGWAALLAALCVYHICFAQAVRGYSLFAFLALLSMVFWVRLFVRPGLAVGIGYIACTTLVLYSHPYGVFHVACQNVMFIVLWLLSRPLRIGWPGWIGIQSLLGAAFSPWMLATVRDVRRIHRGQASTLIPSIWDIPGALKAFAGDADFIADWCGNRYWLGGLFVALMLAGLWSARWREKNRVEETGFVRDDSHVRRHGVVLVSTWLACTVLIPYIVSMVSVPVFSNRYMISGSFAFLLLVALGIHAAPWRAVQWGVGAGVILTQLSLLVPYYTRVNQEQWRELASYVESGAEPGDLLLFHAPYCRTAIYWYYARRNDLVVQGYPSRNRPMEVNPVTIREELLPLLEGRERVYLVLSHSYDKEGLIRKALDGEFACTDSREFYRASVSFHQRRGAASSTMPTETRPSAPAGP